MIKEIVISYVLLIFLVNIYGFFAEKTKMMFRLPMLSSTFYIYIDVNQVKSG